MPASQFSTLGTFLTASPHARALRFGFRWFAASQRSLEDVLESGATFNSQSSLQLWRVRSEVFARGYAHSARADLSDVES
jgi:hypothetical protein